MYTSTSSTTIDRDNRHKRYLAGEFEKHREQLRKTVVSNLDQRLARRVDPSDILQDAYIEAIKRYDRFLATKPMDLFDWLRVITKNITRNTNSFHINAGKRSLRVEKEVEPDAQASIVKEQSTPSHTVIKREMLERRAQCMQKLPDQDRDILRYRHDLNMSNQEIAHKLGISQKAASKRYYRALQHLTLLLAISSK